MRRLTILLIALLSLGFAQYESRLLVGLQETQAIYPGGGNMAFGPAELIAQALGLGYLEANGKVYLSLGSRVAAFGVSRDGGNASRNLSAYRTGNNTWVPVRELAKNLDLYYRNDYGASVLALKPARLTEIKPAKAGNIERYIVAFDRDVQVRLLDKNPPRLALIGVTEAPDVIGDASISLSKTDWGYELTLPSGSGAPRLLFLPQQVIVERGSNPISTRVVLDPGHGGTDSGVVVDKLNEKDLTLSVVNKLGKILSGRRLEVIQTRSTDQAVPLIARAQYATSSQVFVSVHAAAGNKVTIFSHPEIQTLRFLEKGRELWPKTPQDKKATLERYIAAPGSAARFAEGVSQAFAAAGIVAATSQDAMYVLSQTGAAAILIEVGIEQLRTAQGRDQVAAALAKAILSYLGQPTSSIPNPTKPSTPGGNP